MEEKESAFVCKSYVKFACFFKLVSLKAKNAYDSAKKADTKRAFRDMIKVRKKTSLEQKGC